MLDEVVVAHAGLRVLLRDRVHQALVVQEQALGRLARLACQGGELTLLQRSTLAAPDEDGKAHLLLGRQQDRRVVGDMAIRRDAVPGSLHRQLALAPVEGLAPLRLRDGRTVD